MGGSFKDILNFNIGVLGHVDSGKTSISKVNHKEFHESILKFAPR